MKTEDVDKVCEFLDNLNIKYTKAISCVLVDRDSIVAGVAAIIPDVTDNEAYDWLRLEMNGILGKDEDRFYYAFRTDEWLMIEINGGVK